MNYLAHRGRVLERMKTAVGLMQKITPLTNEILCVTLGITPESLNIFGKFHLMYNFNHRDIGLWFFVDFDFNVHNCFNSRPFSIRRILKKTS